MTEITTPATEAEELLAAQRNATLALFEGEMPPILQFDGGKKQRVTLIAQLARTYRHDPAANEILASLQAPAEEPKEFTAQALLRRDINRYPRLTAAQERALFGSIERGLHLLTGQICLPDATARTALTTAAVAHDIVYHTNLRLVMNRANKYDQNEQITLDLIDAGAEGLEEAIGGFDVTKGFRFSTYATWIIDRDIKATLPYLVRRIAIPKETYWDQNKLRKKIAEFQDHHGRQPTINEQARLMEASPQTIKRLHDDQAIEPVISVEDLIKTGQEERAYADSIRQSEHRAQQAIAQKETLRRLLVNAELTEEQYVVLAMRNGLYLPHLPDTIKTKKRTIDYGALREGLKTETTFTLQEIGDTLGMSRERARQIEAQAYERIRRANGI